MKGSHGWGLTLLVQIATAESDSGLRPSQTVAQLHLPPGTQGSDLAHLEVEASWSIAPVRA